jgi:hypothetical protein
MPVGVVCAAQALRAASLAAKKELTSNVKKLITRSLRTT